MKSVSGRFAKLSRARRMIGDFLYAGRSLIAVPIHRRMRLGEVVAARAQATPRPSWCAIFTKALAATLARHPEARRAYVPYPWPRLFEYDTNVAAVAVERKLEGESAIFIGRLRTPESMSLLEIDRTIRNLKESPIESISGFRGALRFARLPHLVRRLMLRVIMAWMPGLRAKFFGTFGVTVIAGAGAAGIFMITPWTLGLMYDVFDEDGNLDVLITFDHRVLDGIAMAGVLCDLEEEVRGPILRELRELPRRSEAA